MARIRRKMTTVTLRNFWDRPYMEHPLRPGDHCKHTHVAWVLLRAWGNS